ncbi:MAG: hypothetical protein ACRCY9_01035 [Phycicoccus sp.]
MTVFENREYDRNPGGVVGLQPGLFVRGAGTYSDGWTPVREVFVSGTGWVSMLYGPNDTWDFIRRSGLEPYSSC